MITHIIWDWNGTLLDDVDACVGAINRMLTVRNMDCIDDQTYRHIFDFPVKRYYERLGFDLAAEDWDAVAVEFHQHYNELARDSLLRAGVIEVLETLHRAAYTMSILSACENSTLHRMLTLYGIRGYFKYVSGLDNLHAASKLVNGKKLLHALHLDPEQVLLIGDTNHDHEVAKNLGISCLLLAGGHQIESRLSGEHIIPHPREILSMLVPLTGKN